MKKLLLTGLIWMCLGVCYSNAQDPVAKPESKIEKKADSIKATFLITGLHCEPCTKTVENSLMKIQGVKSAKVDWNSKNARVEFDEKAIPVQQLLQRIAVTPHFMGSSMQYGGWLALKVSDVKEKDDATWNRLKDAIGKVQGVKQVSLYKPQASVGIQLDAMGYLTSQKLIATLADAGFKLSNL